MEELKNGDPLRKNIHKIWKSKTCRTLGGSIEAILLDSKGLPTVENRRDEVEVYHLRYLSFIAGNDGQMKIFSKKVI